MNFCILEAVDEMDDQIKTMTYHCGDQNDCANVLFLPIKGEFEQIDVTFLKIEDICCLNKLLVA